MRRRPGLWLYIPGGVLGFVGGCFGAAWSDHMHQWWSGAGIVCFVALILLGIASFIAGLAIETDD